MRKSKVCEFIAGLLNVAVWALFIVGLVLVYRFFVVDLYSGGSKLQSIGAIGLVTFAMWWLLSVIDDLEAAEDEALDAEYKELLYSGLLAHEEENHK